MLRSGYIKHIRRWLKWVISRSERAHWLYNSYSLLKQARTLKKKVSGTAIESRFVDRERVVYEIKRRKKEKCSEVCHIIGSGWSLNRSLKKISSQDFVIGFNYAAISNIDFDVYFFEFGGENVKEISTSHLELCRSKLVGKTDSIYFKNIQEAKNDTEFIVAHWIEIAKPVLDHFYNVLDKRYLRNILGRCLGDQTDYIPQLCSTVVTTTILAYQAGFKKIVVHGLDFGGQYFYECMDTDIEPKFLPPTAINSSFYKKNANKDVHPTASGAIGMREIICILKDLLEAEGVRLMCGCSVSPSHKYLPVYLNKLENTKQSS